MASRVLHLLTIIIGTLFIFFGYMKLTPRFFSEYHERIKNEFGNFNKEFPLYRETGWRPYAKNYRLTIGIIELVSGSLLLLGFAQTLATITLLTITTNATITFQKLEYPIQYILTTIFISFVLVLRLALESRNRMTSNIDENEKKFQ